MDETGRARIHVEPAVSGEWETVETHRGPHEAAWDQTSDGAHVVWLEDVGDGQVRFAWDGVAGRPFELIPQRDDASVIWSPDHQRVAYYGRRDDGFFVGIDGTEIGPLHGVTRSVPPTFSADGMHVAFGYFVNETETRLMVDGDVLGEWKPAPRPPVWSPDGMRLAFAAESRRLAPGEDTSTYRQWIVLDGVDQPEGNGISADPQSVAFSPDSRRFLYGQIIGDQVRIVIDGATGDLHHDIAFATWSPDSRRVAYAAGSGDRFALVDGDGMPGPAYWRVGPPVFSPDSSRLAYLGARAKGRGVAVIDGIEGPEFADLWGNVEFSPDSRRVAYLGLRKSGFLGRTLTVHLVLDGTIGDAWDEVSGLPRFSPDSRRVAFPARRGKAWHMVVDGQPGPTMAAVGPARWSSSGRLGYMARDRAGGVERSRPVIDGFDLPWLDEPVELLPGEGFVFSPDGEHVATAGLIASIWRPIVDGKVGPGGTGVVGTRFRGKAAHMLVVGLNGAHEVAFRP